MNTSLPSFDKIARAYVGFVEVFLALRFLVLFFALEGKFVTWIVSMTNQLFTPLSRFVQPYTTYPQTSGMLFSIDFATITAMVLYFLFAEVAIAIYVFARHIIDQHSRYVA